MATGDGIQVSGSYATVQESTSTVNGDVSAGAVTDIATAIPSEANYFLLDFKSVVAGTPTNDPFLSVYKRPVGQPVPTAAFPQIFVGNAILDVQSGDYFLRGVPNDDPLDTYYVQNRGGATLTIDLQARGRTYRVQA